MDLRDVTCAWWDPFTDKCQLLEGKPFDRFGCSDCQRNPRMRVGWRPRAEQVGQYRDHGACKILKQYVDCFGNEYYVEVER